MSASKKGGKKYDVHDDSFESHVMECLETIRQDVETIGNNQAKLKEDLKSFKHKLDNTTESLNLKFDTPSGEVRVAMTRIKLTKDLALSPDFLSFKPDITTAGDVFSVHSVFLPGACLCPAD